ncbi:maltokinase N-terminal cap-like domain-containing protein [Nonomuraea salmonea]|uniref:maltokinase N-terminal cap-like domain-containing protein n=1 Tax=Nonomuraea salmonea TaxID=46181 RepID=UPI002FE95663
MAVIHHTTLKPTKLELLTAWLPTRPWYRGSTAPELSKAGGFRLDDPEGAVGIEFMVVNDTSGDRATAYLVPLTYRGAPLADAEHALIGTAEHGVLGRRWIYDGCHDPVLIVQLTALLEGQVAAQDQNATDTPRPHHHRLLHRDVGRPRRDRHHRRRRRHDPPRPTRHSSPPPPRAPARHPTGRNRPHHRPLGQLRRHQGHRPFPHRPPTTLSDRKTIGRTPAGSAAERPREGQDGRFSAA